MTDPYLAVTSTFLGVLIGGVVSLLSNFVVERQRRRHGLQEKLASVQREAIAAALELIEPMRNAYSAASMLIGRASQGSIEHEKLVADWPRLLDTLARQDLSAEFRAVLSGDIYSRGHQVWLGVERLLPGTVKVLQAARAGYTERVGETFRDLSRALEVLHAQIEQLETDLRAAYRRTFE
jgi:hypothetical protein